MVNNLPSNSPFSGYFYQFIPHLATKNTPLIFQVIHFFSVLIKEWKHNFSFTEKRQKSTKEKKSQWKP